MTSKNKITMSLSEEKGFTLIEILIILLIGIIAAIAFPNIFNIMDLPKEAVFLANWVELKNSYLTSYKLRELRALRKYLVSFYVVFTQDWLRRNSLRVAKEANIYFLFAW